MTLTPIYIDLDTDGGGRGRPHTILEIAAFNGENKELFHAQIDGVQRLPKNQNRSFKELYSSQEEALNDFTDWLNLNESSKLLVAHNAKHFDAIVYIRNLDRCKMRIPLHLKLCDSMDIMKKLRLKSPSCKFT